MELRRLFLKKPKDAGDPNNPETVPGGHGVRALNNWPLILGSIVILGFLGVMIHVMIQRSADQAQQEKEDAQKNGGSASKQAEDVAGAYGRGGLIPPNLPRKEEPAPAPEQQQPELQLPDLPVTAPSRAAAPAQRTVSPEESALWNARYQALQAGLRAKTGVQLAEQRTGASPRQPQTRAASSGRAENDVTAAYQARLAQIRGELGSGGNAGGASSLTGSAGTPDNSFGQFDRENTWDLKRDVEAPASPYELRAGFVIPAIMISGINSDLPGQVMAQVSQNVFDTATGKYLLIPQGTRLIGTYNSSVAYGQQRILMAWQRLIFPDGKALDIGAMPGADSAGYGGFNDQVNNHYLRIFGSSLLLSGVVAGVALSQDRSYDSDSNTRQRASDALSEALGQTMGSTMSEMLRKNLNISPTLEIRPGYRFNVMVVKDVRFKEPYKAFSY